MTVAAFASKVPSMSHSRSKFVEPVADGLAAARGQTLPAAGGRTHNNQRNSRSQPIPPLAILRGACAQTARCRGCIEVRSLKGVQPAGVEPTTFGFGDQRSIQLSYGCILKLRESSPDFAFCRGKNFRLHSVAMRMSIPSSYPIVITIRLPLLRVIRALMN